MKKIEEVAAILIEEINDFKLVVSQLKELVDTKPSPSIGEEMQVLRSILKQSSENQNCFQKELKTNLTERKYQQSSYRMPKWLLAIFGITSFLLVLLITYSTYQIQRIPDIQQVYFQKGQDEAIGHFRLFFDDDEAAAESYENWITTKK